MIAGGNARLDAALSYAAAGLRVVLLHERRPDGSCSCSEGARCKSAGKHPRFREWPKHASCDEEAISNWFKKWPDSNVGVQLGQASGIIDIETDSPIEEALLQDLFDGEVPVCPTFTSNRGKHRLFRWRDDLPGGATCYYGKLCLRVGNSEKGSQSVFPPSTHPSGKVYQWLPALSLDEVEPPDLPEQVVVKLCNLQGIDPLAEAKKNGQAKSARKALYDNPAVQEGSRDNTLYAEACALWNEQFRLYGKDCFDNQQSQVTVYTRLWVWNVAMCKPPLDESDVRQKYENAREFVRKAAEAAQKSVTSALTGGLVVYGLEYRNDEYWPGKWRLECFNSDPPSVRIYAPFLPRGFIDLTMDEFDNPNKVHRAVLKLTGTVAMDDVPGEWPRIWKGMKYRENGVTKIRRGLEFKLLDAATKVEAPPEVKRGSVVAEFIWEYLAGASKVKDEDESPQDGGHPWRRADGAVWFSFASLMAEADFHKSAKLTRNELSACVRECGAENRVLPVSRQDGRKERKSFFRLPTSGLAHLRALLELPTEPTTAQST